MNLCFIYSITIRDISNLPMLETESEQNITEQNLSFINDIHHQILIL